MSRKLTASDRSALIRLASTMPKGSEERRAILAGLKTDAWENDTQATTFTDAQKKQAVKMAKDFFAFGSSAAEASKESYRRREAGEDVVYWQAFGGFYAPSPTAKQRKWKWLNDTSRVTPGKMRLVIRAAVSPFAVAVLGIGRVDGEKKSEVFWESKSGAADAVLKPR